MRELYLSSIIEMVKDLSVKETIRELKEILENNLRLYKKTLKR